jgi:hypothetical protein
MIALLFLFIPQQIPWPVTTVRKSDPVKIEKAIWLNLGQRSPFFFVHQQQI